MIDLEKYKLQKTQPTQSFQTNPYQAVQSQPQDEETTKLSKYKLKPSLYAQREPDFIDKVGEFGSQAWRSIWRTVETVANIGRQLVGKDKVMLPEWLTRKWETPAEKAWEVFGEAVQYMTPMWAEKITAKWATILSKLLAWAPKYASSFSKLWLKSVVWWTELAWKTALMWWDKEDVKTAWIIWAVTPPALKAAGATGKFVFWDVMPAILGSMTWVAPNTIKMAFKNPIEVARYMSEKVIPLEVRTKAIESLGKYRQSVSDTFESGLNKMAQLSPRIKQARTKAWTFSGVKKEFKNILEGWTENLKNTLNKFRISIKNNNLNFDKLNSAIVSPTERKQIQNVWNTLKNQTDFSAKGVQDVAARINAFSKFTEWAQTRSSAVIWAMHNMYSKAIEKVYPELGKLRAEYRVSQQIMEGIDDILKSSKNEVADPNVSTSVAKKLVNLFNEDNEAYVRALKKLEDETGDDLINQFVAANFDKLVPWKFGSYLGQAGVIAGTAITGNPMLLAVLPLFSPKLIGRIVTTAGKVAEKSSKIRPLLPNILK